MTAHFLINSQPMILSDENDESKVFEMGWEMGDMMC